MSPLLKAVNNAGINAINKRNDPWQIKSSDWFEPVEELRSLFSQIIGSSKENIALIPSASYGLAVAAHNIQLLAGEEIIVLHQQYPSNVYVWRELSKRTGAKIITIERSAEQTWTEAIIEKINARTGLVAIPNCHWTDGSLIDLEKVSVEVKKVNAKLVIDASQSLGAYPLDIHKIDPDFLITVGYKWLLGPYGLSYLYASNQYCETGTPIEFSWLNKKGSEDFSKLVDYVNEYKTGARRFDAGASPNFIHIQMATEALTQILAWKVENIQDTLAELTNDIQEKASQFGLVTPPRNSRVGHMIGVRFTDDRLSALSKKLADNQIFISVRGTSMRIAPHLFNNKSDIDRLFSFFQVD
jgi:selenocysteine lyase/cysteine desulfurase